MVTASQWRRDATRHETNEMDSCQILVLESSYRKPPIKVTTVKREPVGVLSNVTVAITLLDLAAIRESKIDLKFLVLFNGIDFLAVYHKKNESSQNILDEKDVKKSVDSKSCLSK